MSYFDLVAADYRDTLILFVLGAIFVALAMRIIKHALFDMEPKLFCTFFNFFSMLLEYLTSMFPNVYTMTFFVKKVESSLAACIGGCRDCHSQLGHIYPYILKITDKERLRPCP